METIFWLIDIVLHLDKHLTEFVATYDAWTYGLLFLIIFLETGIVVTPFLPGDSLLFAAGTLAGLGSLNVWLIILLLCAAAIIGDTVNYWIGRHSSSRFFKEESKLLNPKYLRRAEAFYQKHGKRMIVLARFIPVLRTFAPLVAGMSNMNYREFLFYNITGGIVWVTLFTLGGYWFGALPFVQNNFSLMILGIIVVSLVPVAFELWRSRKKQHQTTDSVQ